MSAKELKSLEKLVELFPEISPPITITEESALSFSSNNKPISSELLDEYFSVWEHLDEYTEIVPCLQLNTENFYSIIYWKGSLLVYEYILATIDKSGTLITKKVIAGTISNGETIKKSVATIDSDLCIYSIVGEQQVSQRSYEPTNSSAFKFEIEPDGSISSSSEENYLWEKENQKRKT